jgi:hypothetical protein
MAVKLRRLELHRFTAFEAAQFEFTSLACSGVQTWIAPHDYLLTSELTSIAETSQSEDTAFFALARNPRTEGTSIESGSSSGI